ncbi:MAG TPA: hypothetical protein VLD13_03810, partial [Gaiellaceae bacterium]|nr:hypothetical protein [Gaiellaceae bacterium]
RRGAQGDRRASVVELTGIAIRWSVPRVVGAIVLLLLGTGAFACPAMSLAAWCGRASASWASASLS